MSTDTITEAQAERSAKVIMRVTGLDGQEMTPSGEQCEKGGLDPRVIEGCINGLLATCGDEKFAMLQASPSMAIMLGAVVAAACLDPDVS